MSTALERVRTGHYTRQQKLAAVTAALATNPDHPTSQDSLYAASLVLGTTITHTTMLQWLKDFREIVITSLQKTSDLDTVQSAFTKTFEQWQAVQQLSFETMLQPGKADKASWKDLGVVAGIATDKLDKMQGYDASTRDKIAMIKHNVQGTQYTLDDMLDEMVAFTARLKAQQYAQLDTIATTSTQPTE